MPLGCSSSDPLDCGVAFSLRGAPSVVVLTWNTWEGLDFAVRSGGFEGAVGERDEFVVAEQVRRLGLHEAAAPRRQLANFDLGMPAGAHLDEMRARRGRWPVTKILVSVALGKTLRAAWRASFRRSVRSGSSANFCCSFSTSWT